MSLVRWLVVFHQPDGACLRPDAVSARFVRSVAQYDLSHLTVTGIYSHVSPRLDDEAASSVAALLF